MGPYHFTGWLFLEIKGEARVGSWRVSALLLLLRKEHAGWVLALLAPDGSTMQCKKKEQRGPPSPLSLHVHSVLLTSTRTKYSYCTPSNMWHHSGMRTHALFTGTVWKSRGAKAGWDLIGCTASSPASSHHRLFSSSFFAKFFPSLLQWNLLHSRTAHGSDFCKALCIWHRAEADSELWRSQETYYSQQAGAQNPGTPSSCLWKRWGWSWIILNSKIHKNGKLEYEFPIL